MGRYLNRDVALYQRALNSQIYVDKTGLISFTNQKINSEQGFICVSRPRRFGKSMAANMLNAYYSRKYETDGMFCDKEIAGDASYREHLNGYFVIQINMVNFATDASSVPEMLSFIEEDLQVDFNREFPDFSFSRRRSFARDLEDVFTETGIPFVFIIDEWDCIFREYPDDVEGQKEYLDYLRNLLKDKSYVALAYMTGILPIKKYGKHSALNMFYEYSVLDAKPIERHTGFTADEVDALCGQYGVDRELMQRWYDGYKINDEEIYNPKSVVEAIVRGSFNNYWTQTETFEALRKYIIMDYDGLKESVIRLLGGEEIVIDTTSFVNDMKHFENKDDVLTLLVHLGYLTFDFDTKRVRIPNYEIMEQFKTTIKLSGWDEVTQSVARSKELLDATLAMDEAEVARLVEQAHQENTSIIRYHDENSLSCVLAIAYYAAREQYVLHRELPTGKGFADLVFIPRKGNPNPALIVELKWNKDSGGAIEQIKRKEYTAAVADYAGEMLLVGISYDVKTKEHGCRIERVGC